jgi:hypothetical protein
MMICPAVVLIGAAAAAAILLAAVLIRRETALSVFADACARRLDGKRLGLFFWGLAELIAIVFVAALLTKVHGLIFVAFVIAIAGIALVGFAIAVAALLVGRKCMGDLAADSGQVGVGFAVVIAASVVPIIGWLLAAAICLASLGAVTEVLVTNRGPSKPEAITPAADHDSAS